MPGGFFYLFCWAGPYLTEGVSGWFLLSFIIEIPVLKAEIVNPDQTWHSTKSDLGLYCLQMLLMGHQA